jgi:uncharacterized protein with HEPN domain
VSRSWQLFLRDMLEAAQKVTRYTNGRQVEAFVTDEMAYDATLRNLEILGEVAKNIRSQSVARRLLTWTRNCLPETRGSGWIQIRS